MCVSGGCGCVGGLCVIQLYLSRPAPDAPDASIPSYLAVTSASPAAASAALRVSPW